MKYFYSFYIQVCESCRMNKRPSCDYECNYWKKVFSLKEIPERLRMNKEYRRHIQYEPKKKWYEFWK